MALIHLPLPSQRHFEQYRLEPPSHYNTAILLDVKSVLEVGDAERIMQAIWRRHLGLRVAPAYGDGGRIERFVELRQPVPFRHYDFTGLSLEDASAEVVAQCAVMQTGFNLEAGPLARFAFFDMPSDERRLLLLMHHLIVDGLSIRIVVQELARLLGGRQLPAYERSTSLAHMAEQMHRWATSQAADQEGELWSSYLRDSNHRLLPLELPSSSGRLQSTIEVTRRLRYRGIIPEHHLAPYVLAAAARVLGKWAGVGALRVDNIGHGRNAFLPGFKLSRVVGWLSASHPLIVRIRPDLPLAKGAESIRAEIRKQPANGSRFNILKYLGRQLADDPAPGLLYNFQGNPTSGLDGAPFGVAPESTGPSRTTMGENLMRVALQVSCDAEDVSMCWIFSTDQYRSTTVEGWADETVRELARVPS